MLFCPLLAACLATLAVASPAENMRAVPNPKTPNQIIDAVVERAVARIDSLNWDVSKNIQNAETDFNLNVDSSGSTAESFDISDATMTGIGSLARSASWQFQNGEKIITGTLKLIDARASADYDIVFAGVGSAPSQTISGSVVEKADNLFADVEINLNDRLVPQSIRSYTVRAGNEAIESVNGLGKLAAIDTAGIRGSLVQLMENTFNTNVKVQINKAIQEWKAEDIAANP